MKVLLFGASGQLGSALAFHKPSNAELLVPTHKDLDLGNTKDLETYLFDQRPEVIINTAAFHKTGDCEDFPEKAFQINAIASRNLAKWSNQLGARLVFISTDYIFNGKNNKKPYVENDLPHPLNTYGMSKWVGEVFIQNLCPHHYIVRVSSLFGKKKGGLDNFVNMVLEKAKKNPSLKMVQDIYMSPTYAMDAAKEIWNLLNKERPFGIFHVTNDGYCHWLDFAKEILSISGIKKNLIGVSHTEYPTKVTRPLWSVLGSQKGIKMRSWKEALKDYLTK